jgi:hypothetical protein
MRDRPRARNAEAKSSTTKGSGDEMNMMDSSGSSKSGKKPAAGGDDNAAAAAKGPGVGEAAPDVALTRLDGGKVQLASLKGRIVVLVFGSYSSPSFRQRAAALEKLRSDLGIHAQMFVVYTKEAHATGEWEVDRNKDDGVSVEQPKTFEARRTLAQTAKEKLKLATPVTIDSIDNSAAAAFGAGENSAIVIGRDGTIVAKQQWFEPAAVRRAVDKLLAGEHPAAGAVSEEKAVGTTDERR